MSEKLKRDGSQCWRCGLELGIFTRTITTLANVYHCTLCQDCRNDWESFLNDHALNRRAWALSDEIENLLAMTHADGESRIELINEIRDEQLNISKQIAVVAQEWVSQTIERKQ